MAVSTRHLKETASPVESTWPWHDLGWRAVSVARMTQADRRMEAETYLSDGYGLRQQFQGSTGWHSLGEMANVWQPSRLKGITLGPKEGTPFLAATQVFDMRPVARKWLSLDRTGASTQRFLKSGTIVVTCSGAVGRATLSYEAHEGILISHDLLRVEPTDETRWGWVYAFLRSPQARAMMTGEKYGHMIKHLGPKHLNKLPIPAISDEQASTFQRQTSAVLALRNEGHSLALKAEKAFEEAVGLCDALDRGEHGFSVGVGTFSGGRRRLEASANTPALRSIREELSHGGHRFESVAEAGFEVWMPGRFKRVPAADGVRLMGSSQIFEINPDLKKRIAEVDFGDNHQGRVKAGWLLMARSGQIYGVNGNTTLATKALEGVVVSEDVVRLRPTGSTRAGFLHVALSHPVMGRPLVKSLAFGSSIPHIDIGDLSGFRLVRLGAAVENKIADLAESAATKMAQADLLEREMADSASKIIAAFFSRTPLKLVEDADDREVADQRLKEIKDAPQSVVRGDALAKMMKQWES